MLPYKKIITWFLIGLLISQEVFRIPYSLSTAQALEVDDHENIVSLLVEEQLFKKMHSDIEKYASRIQAVLPRTRTVILTFPENAQPLLIASANERLYYTGLPNHGEKTQKLIGTILIGNLPLPTVHTSSKSFLSVFPYVDFDEPNFTWNWETNRYEYLNQERKSPQPEIWHSVIAPHTGDLQQDVAKIRTFFARVYSYDNKTGDYADLGKDPQVLYADSVRDARATSPGSLETYEQLFIPNQEHFEYNRYTKEFARYLYENYIQLMKTAGTSQVSSFSQWKSSSATSSNTPLSLVNLDEEVGGSSSFLSTASDISTRLFSQELLSGFLKTLSEKYIGDVSRWIHQTGRYYNGYSEVRADTLPELIQERDTISARMLKEANDALERLINGYIEESLSVDIPVLVSRNTSARGQNFTYTNYFLGKRANTISSAAECSIIRGSSFGTTNTTAEMNHGYHVQAIEEDAKRIEQDAADRIRCDDRVTAYWGGNTAMNLDFSVGLGTLKEHTYQDFPVSIFDPAGGKKTEKIASPFDCLGTDLLLEPYVRRVGIARGFIEYKWPKETDGKRYSCATNFNKDTEYFSLNPSPETTENIFRTLSHCQGNGNVTLLGRDGKTVATCVSTGSGGTYKLVSSLVPHVSPDNETYGKQLSALATPNLPVDENRYVLYVNRDLQEKRFDYPNVFDITIPVGATDEDIKQKIYTYLEAFDTKLATGNGTNNLGVFTHLVPQGGRKTPLSLKQILASSPDLENNLIASIRWRNIPTAMKYQQGILDALRGDASSKVALFGHTDRNYEIAYLGGMGDAKNFVIGYNPDENMEYPEWYSSIEETQNNYKETPDSSSLLTGTRDEFSLSEDDYENILGESPDASLEEESTSDSCNYENAVLIWEWLSAIQCWLKNLFKTEWEPGMSDFSFDWSPYLTLSFGDHILFSTTDVVSLPQSDTNDNHVLDSIESPSETASFALKNTPSSYVLEPRGTVTLETYLEKNTVTAGDNSSQIQLVPLRIANLDTGKVYTPQSGEWEQIQKQTLSIAGSSTLRNGKAVWTIHSVSDARMSFEFETRIQSGNTVFVRSAMFTLSPESKFPAFTLLSSPNTLTPRTVRADDQNGLTIQFASQNPPKNIDIDIADYVTTKSVLSLRSVPVVDGIVRIGSPAGDTVLHKAGKYTLTMTSEGVSEVTDVTIVPGAPKKIRQSIPTIILANETYTTDFTLEDAWGNALNVDSWTAQMHTSQPVIFGSDTEAKQDISFPLSETLRFQPVKENTMTMDITVTHNQDTLQQSTTVSVLSEIVIESTLTHAIVGEKLPIEFTIKTKQGNVITQWNSPLRIFNKGTGAHLENTTVSFTEGKGRAVLNVGTQTGITSLYSPDILTGKKIGSTIEIRPDVPHRLTFSGPDTLLARSGYSQVLEVHIFDKYGNYIHPATVDVRIDAYPADLLESLGKVTQIQGDTYGVRLINRGYPGRVLLRGAVWRDGKKVNNATLENVWKVQILPVITSNDIARNTWNSLTQVLLGGPFGQFVTSGYFAGSALFSPKTQVLSMTTLVDTPKPGLFSVSSTGGIQMLGMPRLGTGLQTNWQPDTQGLFSVLISDKRLGDIAKVTYPTLSDKDVLSFKPANTDTSIVQGVIYYKGTPIASLQDIFSQEHIGLSFASDVAGVRFNVSYNTATLGTLDITYAPRTPVMTGGSPQTFIVTFLASHLVSDMAWGSASSAEASGIVVREPSSESVFVGGPVDDGYSAYPDQYGMGWTGTNIGLLEFASGEYWASTQQSFADYVTINLGDPLISLPEYNVDDQTGFDATIGVPVYQSTSDIASFDFADTNNDNQKDIIVTDSENTLAVGLSKKDGTYLDVGEILSLGNAREGSVRTGDFFADGYADTAYIDQGGLLHIVSQDAGSFTEISLQSNRDRDIGQVSQMEVFDMDHDAHDDIIILDSLGQLSIFYGANKQTFIYQFVDHVFDFAFAEKSLFSGAIHYAYPGFTFPDFTKTQDPMLRLQQEQIQSVLFTSFVLPSSSESSRAPTSSSTVGSYVAQSFVVDVNAGTGTGMANIAREYANLAEQYGDALTVQTEGNNRQTISLLKAPFIDTSRLEIHKKYSSLEKDGSIVAGAMIQGVISLKNLGSSPLSELVISENFPSYLVGPISSYTLKQGGKATQKNFIASSEGGVADLRDIRVAPGETIELVYTAQFAAFSFGTFDVGLLEDKNDPLMNIDVPKEKILSINPQAQSLASIPEKAFYGSEKYGDIRINPNNTCGGPLFLWRSHNTFDRTYQKTLIVRNIADPDEATMDVSNDPLNDISSTDATKNILSSLSSGSREDIKKIQEQYASTAEKELETFQADTDGDYIPDRYDTDYGDVFTLENSGNSSQISVGLGKLDKTIDQAIEGVETFMSGLSCGFGQPGCIAQPMNWAANIPGNTITALGYAVPGINQAPIACYKDVRCGIPLFSFPTASYPYFWPPNPDEAGGAFDIGASGVVSSAVSQNTTFTGGYGTSQFRLFVGATLTGALAEVVCFGPNNVSNPIINFPGLFPVRFDGNCIFATQPLTQCSDDGSDDIVSDLEMDETFAEEAGESLTDGDSCGFFDPVTAYPDTLIKAVAAYVQNPTSQNLQALRTQLSDNASLVTGGYTGDQSLLFTSSSPYANIQSLTSNDSISYPEMGSGSGIIRVTLDSTSFDVTKTGPIFDVKLKSITAFPRFIMDWYHRQMDEIVSSFSSLPDIKIFLPDLGSGFADGGWVGEFQKRTHSSALISSSSTSQSTSSDALTPLDAATGVRDSVVSGIQGGIGGIQAVFEYLSLLPMVDVHPEMISFHLPWLDRSAMQSWIYRNEAILAQWEALPANAFGNAVNFQPLIGSIRSNIEIVKTYMTLPEQLQNLFYLKEKFLYEILKNIHAVQQLMGGWLYDNGYRFKTWVETFILITKLWDLWQILIDIFDDYEQSCAVCHNEQWNLQEWLWIIISAVIPPIPVVKMPRWPDIELDFSDIDLGVDIAYPVFNFSFYALDLPDMPSPMFTGLTLPTVPQLPPLPDLNLDFEIPTINLPKLPNLPPAPIIPELSQSISVVLKIFKIVTLIQCLYRKVPLSPEWYVGTKVAHKTDRQGYLPIDFLNMQMPSLVIKWIDAIRVSTHVELTYDVNFIIEMIRSALEPLSDFPRDLSSYTGNLPSSVNINLDSENGSTVQTSSVEQLPDLIGLLYQKTLIPTPANTASEIQSLSHILASHDSSKNTPLFSETGDVSQYTRQLDHRVGLLTDALQKDITDNKTRMADLSEVVHGKKTFSDIAWFQDMNPTRSHLAAASHGTSSAFLDTVTSWKQQLSTLTSSLLPTVASPLAATPTTTNTTITPVSTVVTKKQNTTQLRKSKGLYITKNGVSHRLNYFYENQSENTSLTMFDDDGDGDRDIFYTIGHTIYRKENHTQSRRKLYITDSPQIFTSTTMMQEFFGIDIPDVTRIPHDMQIFLRHIHTPNTINADYIIDQKNDHKQFDIYTSWGQSDPIQASYRVDSMQIPDTSSTQGYALMRQPVISHIAGQATLHRKKVYRTLLPGAKYIDPTVTALQNLSTDFVIRAKKMGYVQEKTTLQILFNNQKQDVTLRPGEVIFFTQDSQVVIRSGALILPSDDYEDHTLTRNDIDMPLFLDDRIQTGANGTVSLVFPDDQKTDIFAQQTWTLFYHTGRQATVQDFTLPVVPGWYYVVSHDAGFLPEKYIPRTVLFDAYTEGSEGQLADTLPTTLQLDFDKPTEVDFQQYFPLDSIEKVEISGISDAFWKQVTATKILFQTSQENRPFTLRVKSKQGVIYTYALTLETQPATLAIQDVDDAKNLRGTLSASTTLPITIQSFLDGKSWTLSTPLVADNKQFKTSFSGITPEWAISYTDKKIFSVKRDTGVIVAEPGITFKPVIQTGSPLVVQALLNGTEVARMTYQAHDLLFQQIPTREAVQKNALNLISTSLRLEPAAPNDTLLKNGAYIVDAAYRPLLAFDNQGTLRYLDTNISFAVRYEGDMLLLDIARGRDGLGTLILLGNTLAAWQK